MVAPAIMEMATLAGAAAIVGLAATAATFAGQARSAAA
jgi:hypothetical protein